MIQIQIIKELPFDGFSILCKESEKEGYNFLKRLEVEWLNNKNKFSLNGEGLFKVMWGDDLIGIGGINQDPYSNQKGVGRIRRFYIKPGWRGKGIGKLLLEYIIRNNGIYFDEINLRTDTDSASLFYEKNGFIRISGHANQSHRYRGNKER